MKDRVVVILLVGIVTILAATAIFVFVENGMQAQGIGQEYHEVNLEPGMIIVDGVDISKVYKGDCPIINNILNQEKEGSDEQHFNDCIYNNAGSNRYCGYQNNGDSQ